MQYIQHQLDRAKLEVEHQKVNYVCIIPFCVRQILLNFVVFEQSSCVCVKYVWGCMYVHMHVGVHVGAQACVGTCMHACVYIIQYMYML